MAAAAAPSRSDDQPAASLTECRGGNVGADVRLRMYTLRCVWRGRAGVQYVGNNPRVICGVWRERLFFKNVLQLSFFFFKTCQHFMSIYDLYILGIIYQHVCFVFSASTSSCLHRTPKKGHRKGDINQSHPGGVQQSEIQNYVNTTHTESEINDEGSERKVRDNAQM